MSLMYVDNGPSYIMVLFWFISYYFALVFIPVKIVSKYFCITIFCIVTCWECENTRTVSEKSHSFTKKKLSLKAKKNWSIKVWGWLWLAWRRSEYQFQSADNKLSNEKRLETSKWIQPKQKGIFIGSKRMTLVGHRTNPVETTSTRGQRLWQSSSINWILFWKS